uniref:NfeD family protein n=1 Tax=Vasconcelosia minhoensis TaxID=3366354 RepID=UPI0036F3B757
MVKRATVRIRIAAGGVGQVMHEGVQWNARCPSEHTAIAPGRTVSVVGRQGNRLFVMPLAVESRRPVAAKPS